LTTQEVERFRQIEAIFDAALEYPPGSERDAHARRQCGADASLLDEVERLLYDHERVRAIAPPRPESLPQFGPWRSIRLLGRGGMGTVYLAERADGAFRMTVAVKVVPLALASVDIEERFRRERQFLASLDHPKIARLIDGGVTSAGLPYLVMEFVDGLAIDQYCEARKLGARAIVGLMRNVLEALTYVHGQQVVHRDIKPSNIVVDGSGNAKLLDFGTARLVDASGDAAITRTGIFAFTPAYASPEQLLAKPATFASDIYSAGVLLYRLLTGRPPYRLTDYSPAAIADTINRTLPDASGMDRALDAILSTALSRRPEQRYLSVSEMDADLARYLEGEPVHAQRPWKVKWLGVAVAAMAVGAAGALWMFQRPPAPQRPVSIAVLPFTNANGDKADQYFVDGLTQEFSSEIARLKTFRMASQSSTALFRKQPRNLRDIGRKLRVSYVVEATVERTGDQIKMVVSLERVADGAQLWANTYRRRTADLGAIETDVETRLASTLGIAPSAPRNKHQPPEQAHDYYLRARFEDNQGTLEANTQAQEDLQRALKLDPEYAAAYNLLGGAIWSRNAISGTRPNPAEIAEAEQLWQKAIQLDPGLTAAHVSLGLFAQQFDWDFKRAEREFQAALAAGPNAGAHMLYAFLSLILGRRSEADEHLRVARDLDPVSSAAQTNAAILFELEGRIAEAREELRKLAIQSSNNLAYQAEVDRLDARLGNSGPAIQNLHKLEPLEPMATRDLAMAEAYAGHREEALRIIHPFEQNYEKGDVPMYQFALFYAALDDEPDTVKWLGRCLDAHEAGATYIRIEPAFAKMRNALEFQKLIKRVGLDY
jgi:serine/threonine protein kinase